MDTVMESFRHLQPSFDLEISYRYWKPKEVKQEDRKPEADIGIGNHMYSTTKGDRSLGGLLALLGLLA